MLFAYRIVLSAHSFLLTRLIEGLLFVAVLFAPCCQTGQGMEYTVWQCSWIGPGGLISPSGLGIWTLVSTLGGLINLTVAMSFVSSFSNRNHALKVTLWFVLPLFLVPLWICYMSARIVPLPGHFLWISRS
jgi:hypothetical protein